MYLLYRHLLRATAGPFLFGFLVITFVLIIDVLYRYIEMFVTKGVPFPMATEVLGLSLGHTFALSIPMAVLIGVLMGVGQLAADHEIIALKASGVSLGALLRPLLAGAAVVAIALTGYNHFVFPESNHRLANLLYDINRTKPMLEIRPQMFADLNDRVTIYVKEKDDRTGRITGVQIMEKAQPGDLRPRLTTATWGRVIPRPADDAVLLELHDGEIHSLPDDNDPAKYSVVRFAMHNLYVRDVSRDFKESRRTARGDREMNLVALYTAARAEQRDMDKILENNADLSLKVARREWRLLNPQSRGALLGAPPGALQGAGQVGAGAQPTAAGAAGAVGAASAAGAAGALPGAAGAIGEQGAPIPVPESHPPAPSGSGARAPATLAARQAAFRATQQEVDLASSSARVQIQVYQSHEALKNRFMVEFHKKFAIPFACLVFVLLGLPLSVTSSRAGRGVSVSLALGLYLIYYLFLIGGEKLSDRGRLSPFWAMWAANILLTAIGIPVIVRAIRESGPISWGWLLRPWRARRGRPTALSVAPERQP